MKDQEATSALIKHIYKRVEEFLDENDANSFESMAQLQRAFSHFLRVKERGTNAPKIANGIVAQEAYVEDVFDGVTHTLAQLKMTVEGRLWMMWTPLLFTNPSLPMPDELRDRLIYTLRFHADRLAARDLDREMQRVVGKTTGEA